VTDLVVTDTSCLIALDRIGQIDLLPALFTVHAPLAVVSEFGRRPSWLHVERAAPERVEALLSRVDRGEAEALALAESYADVQLLIDEKKGRRVARALGLRVTGTAGVLLAAKAAGLVPTLRPLLDALLHEHDFRLGERHYKAVLREAGEA
jgi:predicted nucleic acid-binding protein